MVFNATFFDRIPTYKRANLRPFWEYREMMYGAERRFYFEQITGNIIMLIPFGALLPAVFPKLGWKVIILGFLFSLSIELIQYHTALGLCEFDDVFNNTFGTAVGYFIYRFVIRKYLKT